MHPVLILLLGTAVVIGGIVVLRLHAFVALIGAAILVSLLAPGEVADRIPRVAEAFGATAGGLGIIIALAAITGNALKASGAADRIVLAFLSLLGQRRAATALLCGGYVLSIPVFFDTVFFLLVPLARSTYARTGRSYLKYLLAIPAGGVATHALVPPTPGPLAVAGTLNVDLGVMIVVGALIGGVAAAAGLAFAGWAERRMPVPLSLQPLDAAQPAPAQQQPLPALLPAVLPILLPMVLIAFNTVTASLIEDRDVPGDPWAALAPYAAVVGNANVALLVAAAAAMWVFHAQRRPTREEAGALVEESLMSAGVIILITAAGGAFGAMLRETGIGSVIQELVVGGTDSSGLLVLLLGFAVASLLKISQGSSTVAMITTAAMLAAMLTGMGSLPFHPVYLAAAIGSGAMVGSWMNDSGFWVFARMGGLTEVEALKCYTPLLAVMGVVAFLATVALALLLPLSQG